MIIGMVVVIIEGDHRDGGGDHRLWHDHVQACHKNHLHIHKVILYH